MFKNLSLFVSLGFVGAVLVPQFALAADDDGELASVEDLNTQPEVFLVSSQHKKDCPRMGSVCLFANGGGTVAGIDVDPTVGIVTTLVRGTQVATLAGTETVSEADAWRVEMIARFRARPTADPIIVAVMDYSDPDGMARKEATAVWQVEGSSVKDLGMRLVFSGVEGFQPRHTYLVRVVQGIGSDEKILAEGNFLLE